MVREDHADAHELWTGLLGWETLELIGKVVDRIVYGVPSDRQYTGLKTHCKLYVATVRALSVFTERAKAMAAG